MPRTAPRFSLVLAWLALLAVGPGTVPGQEGSTDPADVFIDSIDVRVVNVDVQVTDKRGRRVLGLGRDDFELFEDGRPVEITHFYSLEGPRARSRAAEILSEGDPGTISRIGRIGPPPEDQQLHLVIYLDNVNIHPLNRQKSMAPVRSFVLRRLGPDDRVMVVSYDRSLNERQPFTTDRRKVIDALMAAEDLAGHRTQYNRERTDLLEDIYDARSYNEVDAQVRAWAERSYDEVNRSIDALKRVADSLAGLPGRKAVLYVSDGIAMRAGEDIFQALDDQFGQNYYVLQTYSYDVARRFKEVTHQASANRITFYTLDAAGLRTHGNADVTNPHSGRGTIVESTHVANLQEPLHFLANETGGQAIVNTNNFGPLLDRVGDDFDTYYSLGYTPGQTGTGRFREIEVRVKGRNDLVVRHRKGYRDKTVGSRMAEGTLAALNYGYEQNSLGIEVQFGRGTPDDKNAFLVPMLIKIPMSKLVFIPRANQQHASVQIYIAARDDTGKMAPVQEVNVPIEIPQEKFELAQQHAYQLHHSLMMGPGEQLVAVGVRDEVGATTAFVLSGVRVGT